jgi:hypothetical protein
MKNAENTDAYPHQLGGEGIGVMGVTTGCGRLLLSDPESTTAATTRQVGAVSVLLELAEVQERLHGELFDLYAGRANWHHRQQEHARYLRSRLERWAP